MKKYSLKIVVKYCSKCSTWGAYNPWSYIVIKCGADEVYNKSVNHGSKLKWNMSELYHVREKSYYKAVLITESLRYKRQILKERYTLRLSGVTYHVDDGEDLRNAYKLLQRKVAIRRERERERRKVRKSPDYISAQNLMHKFGWCSSGVKEFLNTLGLPRSGTKKQLIKAWKNADFWDKETLRDSYGSEIAELLNYCRH